MPNITDIIKKASLREDSVTLYLAGKESAEVARLERQLADLSGDAWAPSSMADRNPAAEIAKKIEAARKRIAGSAVEFKFRALGAEEWSDLVAAHPSADKTQRWDPITFGPACVVASCYEPAMTAEQCAGLYAVLNTGQREDLENCAFEVNATATSVPFSVSASAILAASTDAS